MPVTGAALDIVDRLETACSSIPEARMANPGQPTVRLGATGDVVKRLQRALWRTPDHSISIDGVFGPQLEAAVKLFQDRKSVV